MQHIRSSFTVNKLLTGEVRGAPSRFFFLLTILLALTMAPFGAGAQKISKYWVSTKQDNGTLYYILPQEGFKSKEHRSELVYDITVMSSRDTSSVNFSYFDEKELAIDSLVFIMDDSIFPVRTEKIFVETEKKSWHYRYSADVPFNLLRGLFNRSHPPEIMLVAQPVDLTLRMKPGKWKKLSAVNQRIFTLINQNR